MLNKVILIGNLGKDPEEREIGNGKTVTNFPIATSERWKDNSGEYVQKTEWHNISAWGKIGELCSKYLKKGSKVYLEGKIQTNTYEKDGVMMRSVNITASSVTFLDKASDVNKDNTSNYQNNNSSSNYKNEASSFQGNSGFNNNNKESDVPF